MVYDYPLIIQATILSIAGNLIGLLINIWFTYYITKSLILGWQKTSWKRSLIMSLRKCFYKLKINLDSIKNNIKRFEKNAKIDSSGLIGEINENLNNLSIKSFECMPWLENEILARSFDRFIADFKVLKELQKNVTVENLSELKKKVEATEELLEEIGDLCSKY